MSQVPALVAVPPGAVAQRRHLEDLSVDDLTVLFEDAQRRGLLLVVALVGGYAVAGGIGLLVLPPVWLCIPFFGLGATSFLVRHTRPGSRFDPLVAASIAAGLDPRDADRLRVLNKGVFGSPHVQALSAWQRLRHARA